MTQDNVAHAGGAVMNTTSAVIQPPEAAPFLPHQRNPWVTDEVLLSLSVWWVRMTRPESADFSSDVALEFDALQRDLQCGPRQPQRMR